MAAQCSSHVLFCALVSPRDCMFCLRPGRDSKHCLICCCYKCAAHFEGNWLICRIHLLPVHNVIYSSCPARNGVEQLGLHHFYDKPLMITHMKCQHKSNFGPFLLFGFSRGQNKLKQFGTHIPRIYPQSRVRICIGNVI